MMAELTRTEEETGITAGGVSSSRAKRFIHILKYLTTRHLADKLKKVPDQRETMEKLQKHEQKV